MLNSSQYIQLVVVNLYHRPDNLQVLPNKLTIMAFNGDNLEKVNRLPIRLELLSKKVARNQAKIVMLTAGQYQDK